MKVWITKDALSTGVYVADVMPPIDDPRQGAWIVFRGRKIRKPNWHATREEACFRIERMRTDRLASLGRSMVRMHSMKIEVPL